MTGPDAHWLQQCLVEAQTTPLAIVMQLPSSIELHDERSFLKDHTHLHHYYTAGSHHSDTFHAALQNSGMLRQVQVFGSYIVDLAIVLTVLLLLPDIYKTIILCHQTIIIWGVCFALDLLTASIYSHLKTPGMAIQI